MNKGKGIIIAAPNSGCGKTLFTLALLRTLKKNNVSVNSAKVGPDYIDPAFHSLAIDKPCTNLDTWAMHDETLAHLLKRLEESVDLIVVEGVMGLFDGASAFDEKNNGSTASLAEKTGWPVILVVDASSQAQSIAALIRGFLTHNEKVSIGGLIFNRVGSDGHKKVINVAMEKYFPEVRILGFLPTNKDIILPRRYLGLKQVSECEDVDSFFNQAVNWLEKSVNINEIMSLSKSRRHTFEAQYDRVQIEPFGQRIAVAQDTAFSFFYKSVLQGWLEAGAEIIPFSPLGDYTPANDVNAIYLPGGYPELFAGELAQNGFLDLLRVASNNGVAVFGECGGYMILGKVIITNDGVRHKMAGLLPLETSFEEPSLHLGYRSVETLNSSPLGRPGTKFKGHEFHYAKILLESGTSSLFYGKNANGDEIGGIGLTNGNIAGSFIHLIDQHSNNH